MKINLQRYSNYWKDLDSVYNVITEINSTISCITFILENSSKYDVSDQVLTKELIDLGLPKGQQSKIASI